MFSHSPLKSPFCVLWLISTFVHSFHSPRVALALTQTAAYMSLRIQNILETNLVPNESLAWKTVHKMGSGELDWSYSAAYRRGTYKPHFHQLHVLSALLTVIWKP